MLLYTPTEYEVEMVHKAVRRPFSQEKLEALVTHNPILQYCAREDKTDSERQDVKKYIRNNIHKYKIFQVYPWSFRFASANNFNGLLGKEMGSVNSNSFHVDFVSLVLDLLQETMTDIIEEVLEDNNIEFVFARYYSNGEIKYTEDMYVNGINITKGKSKGISYGPFTYDVYNAYLRDINKPRRAIDHKNIILTKEDYYKSLERDVTEVLDVIDEKRYHKIDFEEGYIVPIEVPSLSRRSIWCQYKTHSP